MFTSAQPQSALTDSQGKPLIRKTPGVCGGVACVRDTRIMVWLLADLKRHGASEKEILEGYPSLTPQDLAAAREYERLYAGEIDQQIAEQEKDD
jgi:uncharacterized protein (DUF433 family)